MRLTTRQAAEAAKISEQSARNYTRWYGALLSPSARGVNGPRLFDDEDTRTLCAIADLRRQNVPQAEIIERLRRGDIYIDATHNKPQQEPQTPKTGQDAPLVRLEVPSIITSRFDAIERRMDAQERKRDVWLVGTGVWLGMLLMGAIFFTMWLAVNGGW